MQYIHNLLYSLNILSTPAWAQDRIYLIYLDFKKTPFNYGLEIPFYSIIIIKGSPLCVLWFFSSFFIFFLGGLYSLQIHSKNKISEIAFDIFIYKIFSNLLMLLRTHGCRKPGGPVFGRSVNPISRGSTFSPPITTSPPDFQTLRRPWN